MKYFAGLLAAAGIATAAFAAVEDDILARQDIMKQVGAAAKAQDPAALAAAGKAALVLFAVDTTGQAPIKTKAADNIWTDWEGFENIMNQMISAAEAGDVQNATATCRTCHTTYRN